MNRPLFRNVKTSDQEVSRSRRSSSRRADPRRDEWRDLDSESDFDDEEDEAQFDPVDEDPRAREDEDDPFEGVARRAARAKRRAAVETERARAPAPREIAESAAALVSKRVTDSERQTARALQNLTELIESGQRKQESAAIEQAVSCIEKRVVQSERHTAKALENIADLVERSREEVVGPEVIEEAMQAFDRRVGESERKTAKALESIAEMIGAEAKSRARNVEGFDVLLDRLGRIETKLAQPPAEPPAPRPKPAPVAPPRADRPLVEPRASEFEQALSGLDRRLADLAAKLDSDSRREPRGGALRASSVRAMERSLDAPSTRAGRPLADAILDITRRQATLDGPVPTFTRKFEREHKAAALPRVETPDFAASLATKRFDELQEAVAALTHKVEGVQNGDGDRVEQLLVLTRQIDLLRRQIDEAARGENPALTRRFDELRLLVENLARQTASTGVEKRFDELQDAVAALTRKVEGVQNGDGDRVEHLLVLTRQIDLLRRQIDEAARDENPALARRFDELRIVVENLARQTASGGSDRRFDELQAAVGALTKSVESLQLAEGDRSDQLLAMTRQIELLRRQIDETSRGEPLASAGRFAELRGVVEDLARQTEAIRAEIGRGAEREQAMARQVEGLRHEISDMTRALGDLAPRASTAAIETALRELIERIDAQRQRGVADGALAPAERIAGELRAVLKDMDPSPKVHGLDADLRAMAERIEELRGPGEANATALRELGLQTAEIKDILATLVSRPLPLEQIETRLYDLSQRVDKLSLGGPQGARAGDRIGDVTEVAKSIRAILASETGGNLNAFNQRLDRLSDKLEQAMARFGGKRFDELGARIDDMHRALQQRLDRGMPQKAVDTSALESLVAGLAKKIDSALESSSSRRGVEALEGKVERIHQKLDRIGELPSTARIEELLAKPQPQQQREIRAIGERLEEMQKTLLARGGSGETLEQARQLREVSERLERMHGALAARLEEGLRTRIDPVDFQLQHKQLREISERLDQMCGALATRIDDGGRSRSDGADAQLQQKHFADLSERLDFMHQALAARIEEGARQRTDASKEQLSDLVEQLARRANSAMESNAGPEQVTALGEQLRDLSTRLDRNVGDGAGSGASAALASIEAKIADLFARIEETRSSATEAAEAAVRRATLDVLRQAGSALSPAVKEELDEIRQAQTETGARTHETLSAVHDTLERVVDRLAVFEEELSEVRGMATPSPAAAKAATPREAVAPPREAAARPQPASRAKERAESQISPEAAPAPAPRMRRGRDVDDLDLSAIGTTTSTRGVEADTTVQANFIAAARRAAERAAADAEGKDRQAPSVDAAPRRAAVNAPAGAAAGDDKLGVVAAIAARKRPILLGLTGVVLLVGALQLMQFVHIPSKVVSRNDAQGQVSQDKIGSSAGPLASGQKDPASALSGKSGAPAGDAGEATKAPTSMAKPDGKSSLVEHIDQTPVGAIDRSTNVAQEPTSVQALAARGDVNAQYEMGVRYSEGRGGLPRDAKAAAEWFGKAASQGMAPAQYRLGSFYEKGIGVERNGERARILYQQAADAGNARAMHNLAVLFVEGGDGKPDYANAAVWFRKAAEYGVRDSQFNLAILYARGLGVEQNLVQSYMWFSVAAGQGDADAGKKRDDVGARLESRDLAAAKALVDSFKVKELRRDANEVETPKNGWQSFAPMGRPDVPPIMTPRPKVSRM